MSWVTVIWSMTAFVCLPLVLLHVLIWCRQRQPRRVHGEHQGTRRKTIRHTIPLLMTIDENMEIGLDTGSSVDDSYELPFKFTGTIDKLAFKLGPSQMEAADQKAVDEMKQSLDN